MVQVIFIKYILNEHMNILGARMPIRFVHSRKHIKFKYCSVFLVSMYTYSNLSYINELPSNKLYYPDLKYENKQKRSFDSNA